MILGAASFAVFAKGADFSSTPSAETFLRTTPSQFPHVPLPPAERECRAAIFERSSFPRQ